MEKKKRGKVSLADVARVAGVTRAAVSYALRNTGGVSASTRQHILQIADNLGYVRDSRVSSWMTVVQQTKAKGLWPIAWLNNHQEDRNAWRTYKYLSPYLEGAQERSLELGHRIEEIWTHESNMKSSELAPYLRARGVKGVIVAQMVRHFRMDWSNLSGVALEGPYNLPSLHRVITDHYFNLHLALKMTKRAGYRRVGVCLERDLDMQSNHAIAGSIDYHNGNLRAADRVPALFYARGTQAEARVVDWLRREKPEAMIGHSNLLIEWANLAGRRTPDEIGIVHLATDDDLSDWAGICSNRREIGATAAELLIARIEKRQFGVPSVPTKTLIRGRWSPGWTLMPR